MGKIKVFTDSTNDLSPELIKENGIEVIPLYVGFENGETYRDGVDVTPKEMYELVKKFGKLPKSASPSPKAFYDAFKPYIDEGKDIIYVGISSGLSATVQNAMIAAQEFPKGRVEVVDSMNLSSGVGLLVLKAVDYANEGLSVQKAAEKVREKVPKVRTEFVIDTLDYLYMGGRCSALQSFMSGIFKIKPIVKVVDGKMILGEKPRGKIEKGIDIMIGHAVKNKDNIELDRIMVTHSLGCTMNEYIRDEVMKKIGPQNVYITDAGCVISSHCGPGTVGILYIEK